MVEPRLGVGAVDVEMVAVPLVVGAAIVDLGVHGRRYSERAVMAEDVRQVELTAPREVGEVARRGLCRLTIGHIAALAGVSRTTAQTAVREAQALGIPTSEEGRITAWRNAPNTIRITSPEWRTWLRMRDRKRAGVDHPRQAEQGRAGHGFRGDGQGGGISRAGLRGRPRPVDAVPDPVHQNLGLDLGRRRLA